MKLNQVSKCLDNIDDRERKLKEVYKSYRNFNYMLKILQNINKLFQNDVISMFLSYITKSSLYDNYEFKVSLWDDYSETIIRFYHQSCYLFLQWRTNSDHIVIVDTDCDYYHLYIGVDPSNIFYDKILSCIPDGQQLIPGQTLICYNPSHDCPICATQLDSNAEDYINWCTKCDMHQNNYFKL